MDKPFHFKEFTVHQDQSAMKIGTDAVLLGAWTNLETNPGSILDIGAGTGIIALQLAQRSDAQSIDAVEIDANAFEQCVENFEDSPWNNRLFCYHADFSDFVQEIDCKYDLLVSNPPFYESNFPSDNKKRNQARFTKALPFEKLVEGVSKLLTETGIFSVIVPKEVEESFTDLAFKQKLHLQKRTEVRGNPNSPIKRSLLQFGLQQISLQSDVLIIEKSRHHYTEEYIALTKDFYLKM